MAYKAPLPMRLFHYVLWATMLFVVAWFFVIPTFLRVTMPEPTRAPNVPPNSASTSTPGSDPLVPIQEPAPSVVTP
jgi:hypothetical protein